MSFTVTHSQMNKGRHLGKAEMRFAQLESSIMETIVALCTRATPFDEVLLPQLDVLRLRLSLPEQHQLAASLWGSLTELVTAMPSGTELDLDIFFRALSTTLHTSSTKRQLAENALSTTAFLVESIGFPFSAICIQLNFLLLNTAANPSVPCELRWKTLARINDALGVSSLLHEQFSIIVSPLIEGLKNGEKISIEHADLVASILRSSASLIKVPLLVDLQRQACLTALEPNADLAVLKLLNALLEHNHEGVPVPVQVARTIFWRDYGAQSLDHRELVMRGRALCEIYVRPRNCSRVLEAEKKLDYFPVQNGGPSTSAKKIEEPIQIAEEMLTATTATTQQDSDDDSIISIEVVTKSSSSTKAATQQHRRPANGEMANGKEKKMLKKNTGGQARSIQQQQQLLGVTDQLAEACDDSAEPKTADEMLADFIED